MSVVLRGGRVVDPGNDRDEVTDLLVEGGRVAAVGPDLAGTTVLDVSGLVVGPGFVDLHSHVHTVAGQRLQAFDGVTTALDLEAGLMPVGKAYADAAAEGRPLNFGFSASWGGARSKVLAGIDEEASIVKGLSILGNEDWQRTSTPAELDAWLALLRDELADGALGIGILMGYAPRTDPRELLAVGRLAAEAGVATYTHVRELVEADPTTPVDGSLEITQVAAETGAHMHHCHVNSTSRRHVERVLQTLAAAQAEGSRVTVEAYPYGAGSTGIGAFFLAPERLPAWGLTPRSLVVVATGERIADEHRLRQLRTEEPGTSVIVELLDEQVEADALLLRRSLEFPGAIVASDAMPVFFPDGAMDSRQWPLPPGGSTHPRTAGTYAKSLRLMVGSGTWDWSEAFRRCSWLPAQVLSFVPDARRKGHLGVGADADVVVLDPAAVTDHATYTDPTRPSSGVRHLLVLGEAVIRDGALVPDAYPGRPLRAAPR
ncbi:MAG: D-glutamate deacylase [Frankiales bacterium]|jgi:N-acyl-D-aspartate/D-glutamate deacylase|nr:D-glutamate deacylase [Frankiales bacterium]